MSKSSDSIEYHALGNIGARSSQDKLVPEIVTAQNSSAIHKRRWLRTALRQSICMLWLAPVIALLVLNFTGCMIGPSLWCPDRQCQVQWFNYVTSIAYADLQEFNKRDHNVLGTLQLVAKALEI